MMIDYDLFSVFYDELTDNVDYDVRAKYYHKLLSTYGVEDGLLLDLACGTGSMAVRMADYGYDVIGVDISPGMLAEAQQKAIADNKKILFLCQPMQDLDLYGTIKATICTLDSLNHLTDIDDLEKTIQRVSLFTEPGGLFIFDVNTQYKHQKVLANNTFVYETEDVYCVWQNELLSDDLVQITLDFFEQIDDVYERSQEQFTERAYSVDTLSNLLISYGFIVEAVFEELTESPLSEQSQRAIFVARKM